MLPVAINSSELQVGGTAIAADIDHVSLHSAQPDASGSNETTAARKAVTPTSTAGVVSIGSQAFTGGAANGACTHVGFWHSSTFRGWLPLTGDQVFNAAGEYTLDSVTLTGSAS